MTGTLTKSLFGALCGASLVSAAALAQAQQDTHDAPLGLWMWSTEQAEHVLSVAIGTKGGEWHATVGSERLAAAQDDGAITFSRPDGSRFAGRLAADGSEIRGYWYQPPSALGYQYVATPVVLPATGDGRWQARIAVQPRPFTVFLDVFEDEDGGLSAVIRNPERNNILGATRFGLEAEADGRWELVAERGGREMRHALDRGADGELLLRYDRFDEAIPLEPATGALADGYYSRANDARPTDHQAPARLDDGWTVARPEEAGFDPAALQALTVELATADPRSARPQMIHSLLVARGGKLVYEQYFFGHDRDTRHDVRSLGKVFGSVMVGALQQQGHAIDAGHRPLAGLLSSAGMPLDNPHKAEITLEQLMTYTSGLDCDANSPDSIGSESRMWEQEDDADFWLYTAKLPMLHDPGTRYAYCSGSANLVGASLAAFGEAPVYELFDRLIARPLDFGPYHWALAPNGEGYLGGGAYMRPRDILKVGAMFAAGGVWNGQQVVAEDWVYESTIPRVPIDPETTGMTPEEFQNTYFGGSQAYIWRVDTVAVGDRRYASYEASGNGGQLLVVVPELDLVVGFTGGNYRMGGIWGRWRNAIIGGHIVPAMTDLP